MQLSVEARLLKLRADLNEAEMYLGPPIGRPDIEALQSSALSTPGTVLPESCLGFLSRHDGLAAAGVFLYSSTSRSYCDGGSALALVEMNLLAGGQGSLGGCVEIGESDMDCYVFEFATGRYQVRDKVAFDNVYQEFTSLDGPLGHIISLIKQHCWTTDSRMPMPRRVGIHSCTSCLLNQPSHGSGSEEGQPRRVAPPSTYRSLIATCPACSESRNITEWAISSGVASLRSGMPAL